MALQCIPNQSIDFCTRVNQSCVCGPQGEWRQKIAQNDATEVQFKLTPASQSLLANFSTGCGVQWTCGAGWSINTVSEVASYSGAGAGLLTDTLPTLNTGVYHKISFDINPSATSGASIVPVLGGNSFKQIGFNFLTPGIWQTIEVYVYLNTKSNDDFSINPGGVPAFDIRNPNVEEMTTVIPVIVDDDNNVLYTFTPDPATLSGVTNVYPTPNIYQIDDAAVSNPIEVYYRADLCMVKILDWDLLGISYGCVRIRIDDDVPGVFTTYTSTPLNYQQSWDCTLLLSWTCDETMFGFNYSYLTFTQYLRIEMKMRNPRYVYDDEENYINSDGVGVMIHAFSYKLFECVTELLPEYVHDSLRVGLIHTDFQVDGVRMLKDEGDYNPQWDDIWNHAYVRFDLIQGDVGRLLSLRRCKAVGVGGDVAGSTVVL